MPSYLPILSYAPLPQDENTLESTSGAEKDLSNGNEKSTASAGSEDKILSSPRNKSKSEAVFKKGGKKAQKKKLPRRDRSAKVGPNKGDGDSSNKLDREKVEKLVKKANSHAQAVQAVKRASFDVQLSLLDGVRSEAQLSSSRAILTQGEYQDVVVERSIDKKCGYPLCNKPLQPESHRKGRYRISVSDHKVYDARETGLYCSQTCLMRSKTFATSLQVERDGLMQGEKLAAIVRSVGDFKAPSSKTAGSDSTDQRSDQSIDSILSEVVERLDIKTSSFEDAGPFDAVEGYTPINSIRDWRLKKEVQQQSSGSTTAILDNYEFVSPDAGNSTNSTEDGKSSPVKTTLICRSSPEKGKSALMPVSRNMAVLGQDVPTPKSILKKSQSESTIKRSVSWGDQNLKGDQIQKGEPKVKLKTASKPRRQVKEMLHPPKKATATTSSASTGTDVSTSSVVGRRDEIESFCGLAEAKAAMGQDIERLSSIEQPIKETKSAEGKSNLAKPVHDAVVLVQGPPPIEHVTGSELRSDGQISTSKVKSDSTEPVTDAQITERLASAKDIAAALMEAAQATAAGELESSEAVAMAGLSILSINETRQSSVSANSLKEGPNVVEETAREDCKWPPVELQEEYEDEVCSSKAGWHDTAPQSFKLEISMFGTLWMALEEWISAATVAFIYGKEAELEDFFCVNGREYRLQVIRADGLSIDISRAFSNGIARALPDVVQALGLRVPLSSIEQALTRMVRTMSFVEALPSFGPNQWRLLVMLFLDGLSVDQVAHIGLHLSYHSSLFRNLLISTGTSEAEYDTFRGLLLPSGRLPSVPTLSGG